MASIRPAYAQLSGQSLKPQWRQLRQQLQALKISPSLTGRRTVSTESSGSNELVRADKSADYTDRVVPIARHARPLPVSPSYFSRQTRFYDAYAQLQNLNRQYGHLPPAPPGLLERVAWKPLNDFRLSVGEPVKATEFKKCMDIVKRLSNIHPSLSTPAITEAVQIFKRDINPYNNATKPIPIDKFGRALGVGRRKSSVARAWVVEGTGEVLINGKSLADAFGRVHDRESAIFALRSTERMDKYNVWALVEGGGTTGQAEALTLAVAKALMAHEPALKPALRRGKICSLNGSCRFGNC